MINLLLQTPPLDVYEHMALDETIVRLRPNEVTLRFYNWTASPAVTFGYAQFIGQVRRTLASCAFSGDFCRRPTGGGVVFHTGDLTFSLVFQSSQKPSAIYEELHTIIAHTLGSRVQLVADRTPASAYAPSTQGRANACFTNPVQNDLLNDSGHKVLGGAIRRFGQTILYQGSLQLPNARTSVSCKQALIEAVRYFTGQTLFARRAENSLLEQAKTLATTQYRTSEWTEKF
jgi:lipoate-protein ligase A